MRFLARLGAFFHRSSTNAARSSSAANVAQQPQMMRVPLITNARNSPAEMHTNTHQSLPHPAAVFAINPSFAQRIVFPRAREPEAAINRGGICSEAITRQMAKSHSNRHSDHFIIPPRPENAAPPPPPTPLVPNHRVTFCLPNQAVISLSSGQASVSDEEVFIIPAPPDKPAPVAPPPPAYPAPAAPNHYQAILFNHQGASAPGYLQASLAMQGLQGYLPQQTQPIRNMAKMMGGQPRLEIDASLTPPPFPPPQPPNIPPLSTPCTSKSKSRVNFDNSLKAQLTSVRLMPISSRKNPLLLPPVAQAKVNPLEIIQSSAMFNKLLPKNTAASSENTQTDNEDSFTSPSFIEAAVVPPEKSPKGKRLLSGYRPLIAKKPVIIKGGSSASRPLRFTTSAGPVKKTEDVKSAPLNLFPFTGFILDPSDPDEPLTENYLPYPLFVAAKPTSLSNNSVKLLDPSLHKLLSEELAKARLKVADDDEDEDDDDLLNQARIETKA